ncbi:hypothetical protein ZOSMA_25G00270 [Zostera marina]|uniref:Uncharacterized protein n=1 Tax=Zostera marina TaxID=29655 RepID=A0A0K9PFD3_ZOSMR|nr:hypothetical protein ZOSMA_25G00270 [Zostera marina]
MGGDRNRALNRSHIRLQFVSLIYNRARVWLPRSGIRPRCIYGKGHGNLTLQSSIRWVSDRCDEENTHDLIAPERISVLNRVEALDRLAGSWTVWLVVWPLAGASFAEMIFAQMPSLDISHPLHFWVQWPNPLQCE